MKILDIFEVGYYRDDDKFECPDCRGKGWQTLYFQVGENDYDRDIDPCETCNETGIITRKQAARLFGSKQRDLKPIVEASYAFHGADKIKFSQLKQMVDKEHAEGLVLLGAGGDLKDWITGVSKQLHDEGIASSGSPTDIWDGAYKLTTSGGRTDLALRIKNDSVINIGKLAIWRLSFGDALWFSDYVVNYKNQH